MIASLLQTERSRKYDAAIYIRSKLDLVKDGDSQLTKADSSRASGWGNSQCLSSDDKGRSTELSANEKCGTRMRNWILVDRNTWPMTPLSEKVSCQPPFHVLIFFANEFPVTANRKGRRTVPRNAEDMKTNVGLREIVLLELLNCSILSVSTLVRNALAVIFTADSEILIDIVDQYSITGTAAQSSMTSTLLPTVRSKLSLVRLAV